MVAIEIIAASPASPPRIWLDWPPRLLQRHLRRHSRLRRAGKLRRALSTADGRLQRDLGVNLAGAALALELMDELDGLRAQLRLLSGD